MVHILLIFYAIFCAISFCFSRRIKNAPTKDLLFAGTGNSCGATLLGAFAPTLNARSMRSTLITESRTPARILGEPLSALPSEAHSFVLSLPRSHHPRAL
ncbi:MAG TPA: hypothetical protein DHV31_03235 [Clostridiales bacterium]|nr:hypothetical protein [Clostridiales bacterium]